MNSIGAGDSIEIRALKNDGSIYRWWKATVESVNDGRVVTINRAGDQVHGPCGGWAMKHASRTFYWFDRPYNLAEVYQPDGRLKQIYIHIATPAKLVDGGLVYTDHELDVVRRPGKALCVRDEDEFEAACSIYNYSYEFQCSCREAVDEALRVAGSWRITGVPRLNRVGSRRRSGWRAASARRRAQSRTRTDTPATDSRTRRMDV
jgi:protein associated with RNAse G/E